METKRLQSIAQPQFTDGGRGVILPLELTDASVFPLAIDTERIGDLIHFLLQVSSAAGDMQGIAEFTGTSSPANAVPLQPKGVGVMLGPQGHSLLVARFGVTDLGLQIPAEDMRSTGQRLLELTAILEREPRTAQ